MTHDYLVDVAYQWLRDYCKCTVLAKELSVGDVREIPDAIGFKSTSSILVECKTSRSDFQAEKKKYVRRNPKWAMGKERWFLVPKGLLTLDDLPKGWGLIYCCPSRHPRGYYIKTIVRAKKSGLARQGLHMENKLLVSIAWRALTALQLVSKLGVTSNLYVEDDAGLVTEY